MSKWLAQICVENLRFYGVQLPSILSASVVFLEQSFKVLYQMPIRIRYLDLFIYIFNLKKRYFVQCQQICLCRSLPLQHWGEKFIKITVHKNVRHVLVCKLREMCERRIKTQCVFNDYFRNDTIEFARYSSIPSFIHCLFPEKLYIQCKAFVDGKKSN